MARITKGHLDVQKKLHEAKYGVSGWKWAVPVAYMAGCVGAHTVLDYGAGKGTLKKVLGKHLDVKNFDPVTFPDRPDACDLVVCTDVLENVEQQCFDGVIEDIKQLARKGVFIAIALHPEAKQRVGLCRRDPAEWEAMLKKHWPDGRADIVGHGTQRLRFMVIC